MCNSLVLCFVFSFSFFLFFFSALVFDSRALAFGHFWIGSWV